MAPDTAILPPVPSISVVIPARNEGHWVRDTVEAVLSGSPGYQLEVLVVDDGSTDGSCDFLRSPSWPEGSAHVIEGEGRGSHRARNRGAAQAGGDILVFLDAHVLPDAGWLDELVPLLRQPTVGLAGLAVRSVADPKSVGHTYVFVDESLVVGWAPQRSGGPYETPCVIACCLATRRTCFEELGGFDAGAIRWGLEDVELSLRAWFLGYRCLVSPCAQVAHYFKQNGRNYSVSWEEYDRNLLRCVLTYFSGRHLAGVLAGIRGRENFARSLRQVLSDSDFWLRREDLRARFCREDTWYFRRFADDLTVFLQRIAEIGCGPYGGLVEGRKGTPCLACGGSNHGPQRNCLLCDMVLPPASGSDWQRVPTPLAMDLSSCGRCGAPRPTGGRFCGQCGVRVAA